MTAASLRAIRQRSACYVMAAAGWAALTAAPAALAGPFDSSVVAANATWTIHLDVEAAVNSTVGQFILHEGPKIGLDLSHLEEAEQQLGVNPLDVVYGVTIYGAGAVGADPILIISGSAALEDILDEHVDHLQQEGDDTVQSVRIGDATGYSIDEEWLIAIGEGRRPGTRRFVAARGMDELRDALRVIVGAAASRRGGANPGAGSILFVDAAGGLPDHANFGGNNLAAGMLESIERVVVDMGEAAGDLYVSLRAEVSDAEEAQGLLQMLQGAIAMGQMMAQQHADAEEAQDVAELLNALSINMEGDALSINLRYSAQKIIERALEELNAAQPH